MLLCSFRCVSVWGGGGDRVGWFAQEESESVGQMVVEDEMLGLWCARATLVQFAKRFHAFNTPRWAKIECFILMGYRLSVRFAAVITT